MARESTIFARSKAQAPQPAPELIARPHVEQELGDALGRRKLVLMLAPAGWGKTCALSRQLAALPADVASAWVTLDGDDDLPRVVACVVAALAPLEPAWNVAPAALVLMAEGEHGAQAVGDELVNALAGCAAQRGVLVFDDLHRVDDSRVHLLLGHVAEHMPAGWTLAIGSRSEPRFPLARLRVRGQMAEFRQAQLAFSTEDISDLLSRDGAEGNDARELLRQTEGWPAGLRLLLSTSGSQALGPGETTRHVFDYLAEEVMSAMDVRLQNFLMRCALLHELTAERCAMVSGMPDAIELFERVERDGLFVTPLAGAQPTLRMHDLFRDFLQVRLRRERADELPGLYERAGRSEDDLLRAAHFLSRAGAWEGLARRIERDGRGLIAKGAVSTLRRLVERVPNDVRERHPALDLLLGLAAYSVFDFQALVEHTTQAAQGFTRLGEIEQAAFSRAFLCIGQHNTGAYESGTHGLERLRSERHSPDVNALIEFHSAWNAYSDGRGADVARHYAPALEYFEREQNPELWEWVFFQSMFAGLPGMEPLLQRFETLVSEWRESQAGLHRIWLEHTRAARALCAGRWQAGQALMQEARDHLEWLGRPRSCITEHLMLGILFPALSGQRAEVEAAARELEEVTAASPLANQRAHFGSVHCAVLRAWWLLDDADGVRRMAQAMEQDANPDEWPTALRERALGRAMVAWLDARHAQAADALQPHLPAEEDNLYCRGSQMRLMFCAACCVAGDPARALPALRSWLGQMREGAPPGGLLLAGAAVREALAAQDWGGLLDPEAVSQLSTLLQACTTVRDGAVDEELRIGQLTGRESAVLCLLSQGMSNKIIAKQLDLSPHTVKRHVANILTKTGFHSRTQLATWYLGRPQ